MKNLLLEDIYTIKTKIELAKNDKTNNLIKIPAACFGIAFCWSLCASPSLGGSAICYAAGETEELMAASDIDKIDKMLEVKQKQLNTVNQMQQDIIEKENIHDQQAIETQVLAEIDKQSYYVSEENEIIENSDISLILETDNVNTASLHEQTKDSTENIDMQVQGTTQHENETADDAQEIQTVEQNTNDNTSMKPSSSIDENTVSLVEEHQEQIVETDTTDLTVTGNTIDDPTETENSISNVEETDEQVEDAETTEIATESIASEEIQDTSVQDQTSSQPTSTWTGSIITAYSGTNIGPCGKETYYNLNMSGVVSTMRNMGFSEEEYPYWVREDGCKMLGDYVIVAADLNIYPRGSVVESSRGAALVCDTGAFTHNGSNVKLDIATTWQ